jgi:uncharacterized protein with FMN-binding domain
MRRIVMWFMSTVTIVVLLFGYHTSTSGPSAATEQVISSGTTKSTGSGSSSSGATGSASAGSGSTGSGSSGSGSTGSGSSGSGSSGTTVTGSSADTQWGPVQVRLTVANGKIAAVDVVEYPNNNPRDEEINSYALPVLVQETMDKQSADIDMVSGATVTSDGYLRSLQSALDRAGL